MAQDPNATQSQSDKVEDTMARVDAMLSDFNSTVENMEKSIHDLNKMIAKGAKAEVDAQAKEAQSESKKDDPGYARPEEETKEFFDDPESLAIKIKKLAELVKKSNHFVVFTGAGISTAAGIADFRSGLNTVLDTGAGKWAKQAAIKNGKADQIKKPKRKKKSSFKAIPTASHMALVALMKEEPKYLKYLISQNCDGLHRRSGIPPKQMSELHGNSTLEVCKEKCKQEYMREYRCRGSIRKNQSSRDRKTGRYCTVPGCKGRLFDTTIPFGMGLPEIPLQLAEDNTEECDLMLSLGSSLTVTPAADMPEAVGLEWDLERQKYPDKEPKHNLCIVNLQKTALDDYCSVRIFAKIDDVMVGLMKELGLEIPKWYLQKYVKLRLEAIETVSDDEDENGDDNKENDKQMLIVSGIDAEGIPFEIFKGVKLRNNGEKIKEQKAKFISNKVRRFMPDEYKFVIPKTLEIKDIDKNDVNDEEDDDEQKNESNNNEEEKNEEHTECVMGDKNKGLVAELKFYGNYREPNLFIPLNEYLDVLKDKEDGYVVLKMVMDPYTRIWTVGDKDEQLKDDKVKKLWSIYQDDNDNDE